MKAVYLRGVKTYNQTTGAFNSQSYMEKKFDSAGIKSVPVFLMPIRQWVLKAMTLSLDLRNNPTLISVDLTGSFYSRLMMRFNYWIFKRWLNRCIPSATLIMDGLFPLAKFPLGRAYVSFIRSSPQCLVFSTSDKRRDHFLNKQLIPSAAIVCASADAFDSWKAFGGLSDKQVFHIPVPLASILEDQNNSLDQLASMDKFLGRDLKVLRIIVSGGNLGPRKGIIPLFDQIAKLDSRRFEVHLFGAYDVKTKAWGEKYPFKVFFHGYQSLDFVKPTNQNSLRVYPALSECMSRIHLQGLFSGDSCLIYQRGVEPAINKWMGENKVFDSFSDIVPYIEDSNYDFRDNHETASSILSYKNEFNSEFDRLTAYVAKI